MTYYIYELNSDRSWTGKKKLIKDLSAPLGLNEYLTDQEPPETLEVGQTIFSGRNGGWRVSTNPVKTVQVSEEKILTKQNFLALFTIEERSKWALTVEAIKEDFKNWRINNPNAEPPISITAVISTSFMFDNAQTFNLSHTEVMGGLGVMQAVGVLSPERVIEILG